MTPTRSKVIRPRIDLGELLRSLRDGGRTGEARLSTRLGPARVWFREGRIVDVEMGSATGEHALGRLLVTDVATCAILHKPVTRPPRISDDAWRPSGVATSSWPPAATDRLSGIVPAAGADYRRVLEAPTRTDIASPTYRAPAPIAPAPRGGDPMPVVTAPSGAGATIRPPAPAAAPRPVVVPLEPSAVDASLLLAPRLGRYDDASDLAWARSRPSEAPPARESLESSPPLEAADGEGKSGAVLLGRYEVMRRIARGGMGTVYLCRATGDGGFKRLFAVKVLRSHLARDPVASRMFLEEACLAARVYHPHVVDIVDVGRHQGSPFIVMDYVEGGTLHDLVGRAPEGRPTRVVVSILLDALSGLHAVHTLTDDDGTSLGLVHCDVSPENLLVGLDGSCRLSDFGSAKAVAAAAKGAHQGKPAYASPEQLEGRPLDARSDIFSMGVVLFTALTGEVLFAGDDVEQTLHNVRHKPVPRPSTVGLCPPEPFDHVVRRALSRSPSERYQSAADMLYDLRRAAIAADCLAETTEIAARMRVAFGRGAAVRASTVTTRLGRASAALGSGPARPDSQPPPTVAPEAMALPATRARRHTLVVALLLAAGIVAASHFWPGGLRRPFSVETPAGAKSPPGGGVRQRGEVRP